VDHQEICTQVCVGQALKPTFKTSPTTKIWQKKIKIAYLTSSHRHLEKGLKDRNSVFQNIKWQ